MQTLESLKRNIKSADDLQSVVKTMKALAAVSIRQYEKAVESLAEYNRTVEMGFQVILKGKPEGATITTESVLNERFGAIVFGSDQGMVGQFNEVVASHAIDEINRRSVDLGKPAVLAVGQRVVGRLEEAGHEVENPFSLPNSVVAITPTVQEVVLKIDEWRMREIDRIVLFYNRQTQGGSYRPHALHLLPVDPEWFEGLKAKPWPSRALPTFTMDWDRLFSSLIRQHLFVSIYRAFAESLASENASRLASMQVAERNIEDRLGELMTLFHQRRQSAITEELFDIVTGFEALRGDERR
jgi:F-type H+-transporting ATPase subunit gamma